MKVTSGAFICVYQVYCFDKSYLRTFYLCFKCSKFLHKKNKNCPHNLNYYTTHIQTDWLRSILKCSKYPLNEGG